MQWQICTGWLGMLYANMQQKGKNSYISKKKKGKKKNAPKYMVLHILVWITIQQVNKTTVLNALPT